MDFEDFSMFNMALLAKHSWRFMSDTSTLLHKILKAIYFPTTSFMNVKHVVALSFTWREIWEARKLPKEGCRWQVGNGKSINIWTHYWLLGYKSLSWANPIREQENEIKITSIFDPYHQALNNEKFTELLPPFIVAKVFKQIIPTVACEDCLIWEHERNGNYSMHNGYRLNRQHAWVHCDGESSNATLQKQSWKNYGG